MAGREDRREHDIRENDIKKVWVVFRAMELTFRGLILSGKTLSWK